VGASQEDHGGATLPASLWSGHRGLAERGIADKALQLVH